MITLYKVAADQENHVERSPAASGDLPFRPALRGPGETRLPHAGQITI